jgi:taurine transport system permease protein
MSGVLGVSRPRARRGFRRGVADGPLSRMALGLLSIGAGLLAWEMLARQLNPLFLPSPRLVWIAAQELIEDGTLFEAILASTARIMAGWGMGLLVGIPVGILMGQFRPVRVMLDPYIEFFRFIPPIAFVTLAVIWLGPGEASKIALIFYTTVFIVTINTIAGVLSVNELQLRAARTLGAGPFTILRTVVVPATVPYMVTGSRLALGNSFLTIVSAEIVAAQQGLGSLIWLSRNFGKTEWVFVAIIALGIIGYIYDRTLRLIARTALRRYNVPV